jgi:hypothetical protein
VLVLPVNRRLWDRLPTEPARFGLPENRPAERTSVLLLQELRSEPQIKSRLVARNLPLVVT